MHFALTSLSLLLFWFLGVGAWSGSAATVVKLGTVSSVFGPEDLDLEGEFVYAVNFSADDPVRVVKGVTFTPDRTRIPGATFLGPQQVAPWMTTPDFGDSPDDDALEGIFQDIRWANSGASERLRATLAITNGVEYKLQILISANNAENRRWDIRINGAQAVDEITSLGVSPGEGYSSGRATVYTYQFLSKTNSFVVEMGSFFGSNDGGDRNPIWQGLTLEKIFIPPTPDQVLLESREFFANQTVAVGRFQVVDRRSGITHALALVPGEGAADNDKFVVADGQLFKGSFDFGAALPGTVYSIRVRATDPTDSTRFLEAAFPLTLRAPSAPSGVFLDVTSISRDVSPGQMVGVLGASDPDRFDRHSFEFVSGAAGAEENEFFVISSNRVRLAQPLVQGSSTVRLRIRATDLAGLSTEANVVLPVTESQLRINEVVVSKLGGISDEAGNLQEWVEIHNLQNQWMDLRGFFLSDDPDRPSRWKFPSAILPPQGFLTILADGVETPPTNSQKLHLNFSLASAGGELRLTRPDGPTLAHELVTPSIYPGVSYGYGPTGQVGFLTRPTPGAANESVAEFGSNEVLFSRGHGFLTKSFDLVLTPTVSNSVIRFTLDGSLPSATRGILYTNPIAVKPNTNGTTRGTRIVRAVAIHPRAAYAPVKTQTYLFVNGDISPTVDGVVGQSLLATSITRNTNYGPLLDDAFLALPAMSLILPSGPNDTERLASLELFDPLEREEGFQIDCGVHATGTTSLASPKLSMAAKFRSEYGASKLRYPIYARGSMIPRGAATEFKELRLRSHSHDTFFWLGTSENPPVPYGNPPVNRSGDAQLGRNVWIDEMQLFMGQPGKHARQVHLFLNGSYHGLYHIQEHPDEDFMASYLPGSADDFHFSAAALYGSEHGVGDTWSQPWAKMKASLKNYSEAKRWVDVTNLCDYMVLSFYAGNDWDWSAQHNWSAAGPKLPDQGGWKFFAQDSDICLQDVAADCTDQDVPDGIFTALMAHAEFRLLFRDRVAYHCLGRGMLTPQKAGGLYDARMNEIFTAIVAETARWQPSSSVSALPWDRNQEWMNEWNYLRNVFFPNRVSRLIQQLRGHSGWWPAEPPDLSKLEGVVPAGYQLGFSVITGAVFVTIDGSDPRLTNGSPNPAAVQLEAAPLQTMLVSSGDLWRFLDNGVDPGALWKTNGFDDSSWKSGPTEIGYGDGGEATVAEFVDMDPNAPGVQKNITTYFRKRFEVSDPGRFTALRLRLLRDDGAVVYLNGVEIWRTNMTANAITSKTLALRDVSGAEETNFYNILLTGPRAVLRPEGNVIAAEIHQRTADNIDISFNLELIGFSANPGATIRITEPTLVRTRTRVGNEWSALVEAFLVPDTVPRAATSNLLISEIQYRPLDDAANEFLEFLNTSSATIDLSDVVVTQAIDFRFPRPTLLGAQERLVVAKDPVLFQARYGTNTSPYYRDGIRVLGPWNGSLANEGEAIVVVGADQQQLFACAYGADGAWPDRADGRGSSLELISREAVPLERGARSAWLSDGGNWRASVAVHGSPGVSGEESSLGVVFNEILAAPVAPATDAIELINHSASTVDVSGWYLSDSRSNYRKYRFVAGTSLDAGRYLVLREADFNQVGNPASLVPFGLDDLGERLTLVQADASGALLRFVDTVEFNSAPKGAAFGRFPNGVGPFTWLQTVTLGGVNSDPMPGFASWASVVFPLGTAPESMLLTADPDQDGLDNFGEYAFASSPLRRSETSFRLVGFAADSGLEFSYRIRTFAPELRYQVEVSHDLTRWDTSGNGVTIVSQTAQSDGSTLVVARYLPVGPLSLPGSTFLRIAVNGP
ncbi:MAG: lamin tail domain-containing protein [Verrucomicrobiales bacterium]|nr:lamin tail domain-containing protein [Verrucomicrobiales bacterium]